MKYLRNNRDDLMILSLQLLLTILVVGQWLKGYDVLAIFVLWCVLWGLAISPLLNIIYGLNNEDEERGNQL